MSGINSLYFGRPSIEGLRHVALFGKQGSGKTTIFRSLTRQSKIEANINGSNIGICDMGINGKVVLVDTAGINGTDELAYEANHKLHEIVRRADVAVYCVDIRHFDREAYKQDMKWLEKNRIPHILVFTKCNIAYVGDIARLKIEFPKALFVSVRTPDAAALLKARLGSILRAIVREETPILTSDMAKKGDFILLVFPDDDIPAVYDPHMLVEEFIARGAQCIICRESDMESTLKQLPHVEMIMSYARSFDRIKDLIPENVIFTSYSLLNGRQRGTLKKFAEGARKIHELNENSRILIAESSRTHSNQYDIGHVKIPRELRRLIGENLQIDHAYGVELPSDLSDYDLIIHGGTNSLSRRTLQVRIDLCDAAGVPVANFGTILAEMAGILDRCMKDLGVQM